MLMPNRSYTAGSQFRYGFNGKENDNDVKGTGNQQDYGMRIYDPRIGKFLSVDPLADTYPWNSPYSYAEGDPVNFKDLDGAEQQPNAAQSTVRTTTIPQLGNLLRVGSDGNLQNTTQLFRLGGINSGIYAPQSRFLTQEELTALIPPNAGAYLNSDGVSMTVYNSNGCWKVSLLKAVHKSKSADQINWIERAIVRLQEERFKLFSTFTKWNGRVQAFEIITNDPSSLSSEYLSEVQKRLIEGKATAQDLIYRNELRKRNILYEINDKHNPLKPKGDANASLLPENHLQLWENRSYYDESNGTWWSIEGVGKKRVYHRFSPGRDGTYHWSGSTGKNVNRKGEEVVPIRENNVPIKLKRQK